MPETLIQACETCLRPGCTRNHVECSPEPAGYAPLVDAAPVCGCDRPMPMEDGLCLKCGREVPGHG